MAHLFNNSLNTLDYHVSILILIIHYFITEIPVWNYDGSSTYQSQGENSDIFLYPVAIFDDPFRLKPNKLVMCDTYMYDHTPTGNKKYDNLLSYN